MFAIDRYQSSKLKCKWINEKRKNEVWKCSGLPDRNNLDKFSMNWYTRVAMLIMSVPKLEIRAFFQINSHTHVPNPTVPMTTGIFLTCCLNQMSPSFHPITCIAVPHTRNYYGVQFGIRSRCLESFDVFEIRSSFVDFKKKKGLIWLFWLLGLD